MTAHIVVVSLLIFMNVDTNHPKYELVRSEVPKVYILACIHHMSIGHPGCMCGGRGGCIPLYTAMVFESWLALVSTILQST